MKKIEEFFGAVTKVVLRKQLAGIGDYGEWLSRDVISGRTVKSRFSDKSMFLPDYSMVKFFPSDLVADLGCQEMLQEKKIEVEEKESVESISKKLKEIAYYIAEIEVGKNSGMIGSTIFANSHNCYSSADFAYCKNMAYCLWGIRVENSLGCYLCFDSKYSVKCYNSKNLTRCFEVDSSRTCSDSYYLHNCENVNSSIMCFNAKNLSYAVGNTVVGPEKFKKVKSMLLEWINHELEKNKSVPLSIFNLGEWKRND